MNKLFRILLFPLFIIIYPFGLLAFAFCGLLHWAFKPLWKTWTGLLDGRVIIDWSEDSHDETFSRWKDRWNK